MAASADCRLAQGRAARRQPALFRPRGRDRGAQGHLDCGRARRVRRDHRPERLRQEHAAVADLRHPHADRRRRAGGRQAGHRAEPQGRLHAAAGLPVRVADHPRKRGAGRRNPGRRHGQGARARNRHCSPATGSASSCTICRASSRAACASAWRWRARCAPSRTSCCSTSRSAALDSQTRLALADEITEILRREKQDRDPRHARHRRSRQHGGAGDRAVAPARPGEVGPCDPLRDAGRRAPERRSPRATRPSSTAISTRSGRSSKSMSKVEVAGDCVAEPAISGVAARASGAAT